jgi:hypothetical protein
MFEPGQIVQIVPEWRDNPESDTRYVVLASYDDRIKIQALGTDFYFPPVEMVRPFMIVLAD